MRKGEFAFINDIKEDIQARFASREGVVGIGDDCAVLPQDAGYQSLVSTDMLMEGTHFLLDDIRAYQLGWKSAAVNFSDLAAMGGEPTGSFLAISLPETVDDAWGAEFMRGYADISQRFDIPLLGGDTTSSPGPVCVCVTIMGRCRAGKAKLRSDAREGDLICVTGTLGDSSLGLDAVLRRCSDDNAVLPIAADALIQHHYMPLPRIEQGLALSNVEGVHAMMDISDGIASDLCHILKASHCDALVDASLLPVSAEALAYCKSMNLVKEKYALCGGEDYELLFTVAPEAEASLEVKHSVIGRILPFESGSIRWEGLPEGLDGGSLSGFRHF